MNKRGEYLVVYRREKPRGLAFPAGHIENGESPSDALVRELKEETGIVAKHICEKLRAPIKGACKRGAKKHLWYVFKVTKYLVPRKKKGKRCYCKEKSKHAFAKFMRPKKIREYIKCGDVDPAWVEIFKKLNVVIASKGNRFTTQRK